MADEVKNVEVAAVPTPEQQQQQHEAEVMREADKVLHKSTTAYKAGELAYGKGLLKAGERGWEYCVLRMGIGHKLQSCLDTLKGEWSKYSSSTVRPDVVIRAWAASSLFGDGGKDSVPYGHYREAYSQLVERNGDAWQIPALVRDDALHAYQQNTKAGLNRDDCLATVKVLQSKLARLQREASEDKAREAREAEQAAKQTALVAKVATDEALQAVAAADATLDPDAANKAREELLAKQREESAAAAAAQAAERERVKADSDAKQKAEREERALQTAREKEAKRQARQTEREAKQATSGPLESLQAQRKPADDADPMVIAGMMVELLDCDEPDSVFQAFLGLAKASGHLSAGMIRAIDHCQLFIRNESSAKKAS